jgi:predicted phage baseplate assembly protein
VPLPLPNLDDRRFQQLVDEAKRYVQQRCPEWTDHNVSDPGVTLIETWAAMTEQVIYRLNRVPDRLYIKFLDLIGVRLYQAVPARADVTFWLSAPPDDITRIPAGTRVATLRTEYEEAIVFTTYRELAVIPTSLSRAAVQAAGQTSQKDMTETLEREESFLAFSKVPQPGDSLVIGLTEPAPGNVVTLRFRCSIEGVGVDPDHPPLVWEAWDGETWQECDVDADGTGGLNRDGDVIVHIPTSHIAAVFDQQRAGWLRARIIEVDESYPKYSASPKIDGLSAFSVGGDVEAANAEYIEMEYLGTSEGVPGQRFALSRGPVIAGAGAPVVEVSTDEGWVQWAQVSDFTASEPEDKHFVLDTGSGEVVFGPAVRLQDGTMRYYGAIPSKGRELRLRSYGVGGGRRGNVTVNAISVLKTSIPYIARVNNRRPAFGGVDPESIDDAKVRGPIVLRTNARAVTQEDYEFLTREAAPEIARVCCVPAGDGVDAGSVRVLVVPTVPQDAGRIRFEQLVPPTDTLERIGRRLDECRLIGSRVVIEPPLYRGVTIVARLKAKLKYAPSRLQSQALDALFEFINPLTGGPDGEGWPFGRDLHSGEIFALLQKLPGTQLVEDVRIFGADPITGQRGQAAQRMELEPNALVFSYEHQVLVEEE